MKQARSVAQATSSLVNAIKGEALDHQDGDMQKRLLGAAQALADATYRMVEAAKVNLYKYINRKDKFGVHWVRELDVGGLHGNSDQR